MSPWSLEFRIQYVELYSTASHCCCVYIVPQGRYIYTTCSLYPQNFVHKVHLYYYVRVYVCRYIAQGLTVIFDVIIQSGDMALHEEAR